MSRTNMFKRVGLSAAAVSAIVVVGLVSSAGRAGSGCRHVHGKFTFHALPASAPCTSPFHLCTAGVSFGGVDGTVQTTVETSTNTNDWATTGVVVLTSDTVFQTDDGELWTKDATLLRAAGAGDFAEVDTIVGGTRSLTSATGSITAWGTFTAAAGGAGEYDGHICSP